MDFILEPLFLIKDFAVNNVSVMIFYLVLWHVISAIFFLPSGYIPVLLGGLLGFEIGLLTAIISVCIATNSTFFIGRYLSTTIFLKFNIPKKIKLISDKVLNNLNTKWHDIFLFYMNPLLPGSSMGYFFGFSRVNILSFFYKTLICNLRIIIPVGFGSGIIDYVIYGKTSLILMIFIFIFILTLLFFKFSNVRKKYFQYT